jgi:sec-independent protein translocase protein TatA
LKSPTICRGFFSIFTLDKLRSMALIFFIGGTEIVFIFFIVLLLFGSRRIPEFAKMMGKGMREFKKATEDIKREINDETSSISDDINDFTSSLKK